MESKDSTKILEADENWACGVAGRLVVAVWRTRTTPARVHLLHAHVKAVMRVHARTGFALCVVAEAEAASPDLEARVLIADMMRDAGAHLRGTACVVSARGFSGAAIRAIITGLSLVAREPYPTRVFAAPADAAAWLAERLHESTSELAEAIERVRAEGRTSLASSAIGL